jgi:hypothetical protein
MARIKTHREMSRLATFEERFAYLQTFSSVGAETFGGERWLNQGFYTSAQWRHVRGIVIARDRGCDLGLEGYEIYDKIFVHHMNPITRDQILDGDPSIIDPELLVCVSHDTHNAIHYGDTAPKRNHIVVRTPGDTKLW